MDTAEVLALFDRQLRLEYPGEGPDSLVEHVDGVVRHVSESGNGWCAVLWSDLDETTADTAIAEQVAYFAGLGREFEWKHYTHDRPADLGERLLKAGLVADDPEALMIAEVAELPTEPVLPEGVRIERVTDAAGVHLMAEASTAAFGRPSHHTRYLVEQVERDPDSLTALVVMAGDRPVCSCRMEFHEGTEFASLWGGGTVPEWRGKGIYKATVAWRTRLAAERGYRYLQVDASDDSRPILSRLGFQRLSTTTPYNFQP
jgi:GNAT superfamily N-acetyltransferase